jgi:hypothetical protein
MGLWCRSYTTAYVALGTLAGCAVAAVYAQLWCDTVTHFPLAAVPSSGDALAYTLVAGVTALINFLVQVSREQARTSTPASGSTIS